MSTSALTQIRVSISGMPPGLLMASKGIMEDDSNKSAKKGIQRSREQEAHLHAHWTTVGGKSLLAIPWVNFYRSFCAASTHFKWKGQKTMADLVAATISCEHEMISLGTNKYEVFVAWVRIPPRTGAMVQMGRPLIKQWKVDFDLVVDTEMYNPKILGEIISHAGKVIGIGPWRPSLKGPYGRFVLDKFDILRF